MSVGSSTEMLWIGNVAQQTNGLATPIKHNEEVYQSPIPTYSIISHNKLNLFLIQHYQNEFYCHSRKHPLMMNSVGNIFLNNAYFQAILFPFELNVDLLDRTVTLLL